jgi:hypothetical protein
LYNSKKSSKDFSAILKPVIRQKRKILPVQLCSTGESEGILFLEQIMRMEIESTYPLMNILT